MYLSTTEPLLLCPVFAHERLLPSHEKSKQQDRAHHCCGDTHLRSRGPLSCIYNQNRVAQLRCVGISLDAALDKCVLMAI